MKSVIFSVLIAFATTFANGEIPFVIDWRVDAPILAVGVTETALSLALPKLLDYGELKNEKVDIDTVNAFDRWAAHDYKKTWDTAGDISVAFSLLFPVLVYGGEYLSKSIEIVDAAKIATMYLESFLLTQGTCGLLKLAVKRDRPFMYYDEWDTSALTDGDVHYSFPSSHTANAFMSATFLSYTFAKIFPDSALKIPVIASSFSVAVAVGTFRILSANHFPSDVISGATIGTLFGIGVPVLHNILYDSTVQTKSAQISLLGLGFLVKIPLDNHLN